LRKALLYEKKKGGGRKLRCTPSFAVFSLPAFFVWYHSTKGAD